MKNYRNYILGILSLMLVVALTACGKKSSEAEGTQPSPSGVENVAQSDNASNAAAPEGTDGLLQGTGEYQGQADTTSIEITVDGKPVVFQLGDLEASVLDGLQPGDPVQFQYKEKAVEEGSDVKVRTLTEIGKAGAAGDSGGAESGALPETKNLSVTLEGNQEQRPAKLFETEDYGIYVPEGFSFDKENNKLWLTAYPKYFATITKLPADYKLEYLKFEADEEMSDVGRVKELEKADIPESMRDAEAFMVGSGSVRIKQYIVKKFDGQGYVFRLEIPIGEPSEGFEPLAYASLNSLVNLK
ncbi:hypothetical protein AWM70_12945 [Paenibacillus yonginensis]|uniref:Lipoprotein n=1 Tax=Paenibacillus yonginensis TaxID=1462996 RepID=A0A1B1N1T8_9BACL|nr:hypothetical protein [Paenibacillus yonginensis]ANS75404.1 hypothetical protein AWM70_12945 [Paenibacillus yonginensis]